MAPNNTAHMPPSGVDLQDEDDGDDLEVDDRKIAALVRSLSGQRLDMETTRPPRQSSAGVALQEGRANPLRRAATTSSAVPSGSTEVLEQKKIISRRMRRATIYAPPANLPVAPHKRKSCTNGSISTAQAPDVCLLLILGGASFKSDTDSFVGVTNERIRSYSLEISQAIRNNELPLIRKLFSSGAANVDGCTNHGESTVHLAARLGRLDILKFLVDEAGVSLRVKDDNGRTPLHDACWTNSDNFELIHFLLAHSPDLLFVFDKKGYSAFQYIPQKCWGEWSQFLHSHAAFLREKVNDCRHRKTKDQLSDAQKRVQALLLKASQFGIGMEGIQCATSA
ncbi:ANK [Seminavis robusta]|uniref:ANK n=1 Tax=Seminavis robusta TaxID=568900 RepID=A0A9N8HSP0_9STRA|nr:ANK [Seminavis robusta]|eukprot:Sro1752_g295340.1 ANK (338) ;mRNA; f:10204-11388